MKRISRKEANNREQNKRYRTLVKNDRKRFMLAVAMQDSASSKEGLLKLLRIAQQNLDKAASKKIIHSNNAARKKSVLFRVLNSIK